MAEYTPSFASKGIAGTALGLGAGALGLNLLNGGLGGILGGGAAPAAAATLGMDATMLLERLGPHEGRSASHHSLKQSEELARARAELDALRAERYADQLALTAERERGTLRAEVAFERARLDATREINAMEHATIRSEIKGVKEWVRAHYVPGVMVMPADRVVAVPADVVED